MASMHATDAVHVVRVFAVDGSGGNPGRADRVADGLHAREVGLYPFAPVDLERRIFEARQFPRASGYPEDAATGDVALPA